jgi:hypothetical protein
MYRERFLSPIPATTTRNPPRHNRRWPDRVRRDVSCEDDIALQTRLSDLHRLISGQFENTSLFETIFSLKRPFLSNVCADQIHVIYSPYAERPEGVAVAPWRHFFEKNFLAPFKPSGRFITTVIYLYTL